MPCQLCNKTQTKGPTRYFCVFAILVIFGLLNQSVHAQLVLDFDPPRLSPGLERLEALLETQVYQYTGSLRRSIADLTEKPLLSDASRRALLANQVQASPTYVQNKDSTSFSLGLGSSVAFWFDPAVLSLFSSETLPEDAAVGLAVSPLQARFNYSRLLGFMPGQANLGLRLHGGDIGGSLTTIKSLGLETKLGWSFTPDTTGVFSWNGLGLDLGLGLHQSSFGFNTTMDTMSQTLALDADGSGPLAAQNITVTLDPEITVGLQSQAFITSLVLRSGLTLAKIFDLSGLAGLCWSAAGSGISLDASSPISVEGYLAQLIEEDGRFRLSGTTSSINKQEFTAVLGLEFSLSAWPWKLSLPLYWNPAYGFSIAWEVACVW